MRIRNQILVMKMRKHKLGLRNRTLTDQFAICGRVVDRIAARPPGKRKYVKLTALVAARLKAEGSDEQVRQLRNQLKAALTARNADFKKYRTAVGYAAQAASFDATSEGELLAAGLSLEAPKAPIGLASAPTKLRSVPVLDGSTGAVALRWKRPVRRCIFVIEYTTDVESQTGWRREYGTEAARRVVRGLAPGQTYMFRVAAQNTAGVGAWSYILARA
jgi:hypothetical protein